MIAAGAAVLAAAVIAVLGWLVHRATRLERLLEAHSRGEADLEAMVDATREPPQWTDGEIRRLQQAIRKHGEKAVTAHCPDCGCELQDEAFEFWCPHCQAAVSYARVAAEGA